MLLLCRLAATLGLCTIAAAIKADDSAGLLALTGRIPLTGASVLVNDTEPAYVRYGAEDLGAYLKSLAPSPPSAAASASTVIAIGAAAAGALGVELPSGYSQLGDDESVVYSVAREGKTIVVVAGRDPHATNTGIATLLRLIEVDAADGPYVAGPLAVMNRPSYKKRGLH